MVVVVEMLCNWGFLVELVIGKSQEVLFLVVVLEMLGNWAAGKEGRSVCLRGFNTGFPFYFRLHASRWDKITEKWHLICFYFVIETEQR